MKLMFLGDVMGRAGRAAITEMLPALRTRWGLDFVVVNGENASQGAGLTAEHARLIFQAGADCITLGDHAFDQKDMLQYCETDTRIIRPLNVMGYDDAPHGHVEMVFDNVRVPASNILLGEGRGFEIAQGRLGPGRIHHCMRLIGLAERALELMCRRASSRVAFGKPVSQQTVTQERIAEARCKIDMARLLTLKTAWLMDVAGNKVAKTEIAMIKVVAPSMACQVIDWAMQVHGGGGMCDDFPLAYAYAQARTLRFADGPDEVHRNAIAKWELGKYGEYGRQEPVPVTRGS